MGDNFKTENELIDWLTRSNRSFSAGLRLGIGDDGALIRLERGRELILTVDLSIEGVHFSPKYHPPEAVGHRALARSLSDIAAMGGRPRFALISLALSKQTRRAWVEKFYRGLHRLAERFRVRIIGGDTAVKSGGVVIDVVAAGSVTEGAALVRSGAKPGDAIFVAGTLGLSAAGLRALRSGKKGWLAEAVCTHLYPEPQCRVGEYLSSERKASAAIDLSDGMSVDLPRLLRASGVGARIRADAIPAPRLRGGSEMPAEHALALALNGGEDYKLLFTVPPGKLAGLPVSIGRFRLARIGEICKEHRGVVMMEEDGRWKPLPERGYDHFRRI